MVQVQEGECAPSGVVLVDVVVNTKNTLSQIQLRLPRCGSSAICDHPIRVRARHVWTREAVARLYRHELSPVTTLDSFGGTRAGRRDTVVAARHDSSTRH